MPQLHELLFFLSDVRGLLYHYDDDDDDEYDDVPPQKWRAQPVFDWDWVKFCGKHYILMAEYPN